MPLDPSLQTLVHQAKAQQRATPAEGLALVARERAAIERARPMLIQSAKPVAREEDLMISGPAGDIPLRVFTPEGSGPFPVMLFFHGGWAWGDLDTHAPLCRDLCRGAGCLVLSVDYRLAPEHPFPSGLNDCYTAVRWMAAHAGEFRGDPARIAVGGDSGGGNFAAAISLMARDQDGPTPVFQLLLWPPMDFQLNTSSWRDYDGYLIFSEEFLIFRDLYLNAAEELANPYAAPLQAANLHGLPPALIISAECDPFRDGGERYGRRLLEAGVPASISRYEGMLHSFTYMRKLVPDQADRALAEACQALRAAFASLERPG